MAEHSPHRSLDNWAAALTQELRAREVEYGILQLGSRSSGADNEQCRVLALKSATFALLEVLNALKQLPQFDGNRGLTPLVDLAAAMNDLTNGGCPRMLDRATGIGKGRDGAGIFNVKKHAVIGVLLLERTELSPTAARKLVAAELSKMGIKGRKKGALSPGTLFAWVEECRATEAWDQMKKFVEEWASDPVEPITKDGVVKWVRAFGASTQMRS